MHEHECMDCHRLRLCSEDRCRDIRLDICQACMIKRLLRQAVVALAALKSLLGGQHENHP